MKNKNDINLPSVKYKKWIILISVAIPVAVAILFGIRIPKID